MCLPPSPLVVSLIQFILLHTMRTATKEWTFACWTRVHQLLWLELTDLLFSQFKERQRVGKKMTWCIFSIQFNFVACFVSPVKRNKLPVISFCLLFNHWAQAKFISALSCSFIIPIHEMLKNLSYNSSLRLQSVA